MDNEAGLEHISRRTTRDVDLLLAISDPTVRGLITAQRVFDLVKELDTRIGMAHLLINRVPVEDGAEPQLPPELEARVQELGWPEWTFWVSRWWTCHSTSRCVSI